MRVSSHSLFFVRELYEKMVQKHRDKGRIKGTKGEHISSHQLQVAYEEYDEGANVFVFRMKSLRQGQSRSLLTQASRHHAAQVFFLSMLMKSLTLLAPYLGWLFMSFGLVFKSVIFLQESPQVP